MNKIFVRPASPELQVRDPESMKPLEKHGEWKPASSYWLRRINDGDVIEATPPDEPPAAAVKAPIPMKAKKD